MHLLSVDILNLGIFSVIVTTESQTLCSCQCTKIPIDYSYLTPAIFPTHYLISTHLFSSVSTNYQAQKGCVTASWLWHNSSTVCDNIVTSTSSLIVTVLHSQYKQRVIKSKDRIQKDVMWVTEKLLDIKNVETKRFDKWLFLASVQEFLHWLKHNFLHFLYLYSLINIVFLVKHRLKCAVK